MFPKQMQIYLLSRISPVFFLVMCSFSAVALENVQAIQYLYKYKYQRMYDMVSLKRMFAILYIYINLNFTQGIPFYKTKKDKTKIAF